MQIMNNQFIDGTDGDKINQIMKAIEIMDISEFHGKNVFEAGDFDSLWQIIEEALKKTREEAYKEILEEMPEEKKVDWNDIGSPEMIAQQSESYGFNSALSQIKTIINNKIK